MYMQSNLSSSIDHGTSRSQFLFLDVMAMERSELCFSRRYIGEEFHEHT